MFIISQWFFSFFVPGSGRIPVFVADRGPVFVADRGPAFVPGGPGVRDPAAI